jgi:hypothetical protein
MARAINRLIESEIQDEMNFTRALDKRPLFLKEERHLTLVAIKESQHGIGRIGQYYV